MVGNLLCRLPNFGGRAKGLIEPFTKQILLRTG